MKTIVTNSDGSVDCWDGDACFYPYFDVRFEGAPSKMAPVALLIDNGQDIQATYKPGQWAKVEVLPFP